MAVISGGRSEDSRLQHTTDRQHEGKGQGEASDGSADHMNKVGEQSTQATHHIDMDSVRNM
jgi:hypothetical protein